jgi:hypothetical protein
MWIKCHACNRPVDSPLKVGLKEGNLVCLKCAPQDISFHQKVGDDLFEMCFMLPDRTIRWRNPNFIGGK